MALKHVGRSIYLRIASFFCKDGPEGASGVSEGAIMLIEFAVSNFRSIRDRQSFNLTRSARSQRARAHEGWRRPDLLPVAAIYGGNAAGKTSLLDAMALLVSAVDDSYSSWKPRGGTEGREPFLLDRTHASEPTEVEVEFVAGDGLEYRYGFAIDDERVVSEYLHVFRTRRRSVLFERELDDYKFGDSFRGPASLLRETTRSNSLFISAAAAAGLEATQAAHTWISETLSLYAATSYRAEHQHLMERIGEDAKFREWMTAVMGAADLGVVGIDVKRTELPSEERARLRKMLESRNDLGDFDDILRSIEMDLVLRHHGESVEVDLPFNSESDGTHALLSFGSLAFRALERGAVCVVDEIDTSLHPLLVRELVSVFADARINVNQAQLIFTTHDATMLSPGTPVEREAVWVAEKSDGVTTLFPLTEFGTPRKEENLERAYLTGRFGGLPHLSIANTILSLSVPQD